MNRHTATLFFHKLREVIAERIAEDTPLDGEVELGRHKGKKGRGAGGKVIVFGLLRRRIRPDSVVYTDAMRSHDTLDVSGFRHRRIDHGKGFGVGRSHINGIENFWSQPKRHLRRFNGIPRQHFPLFLAQCEWRFNYGPATKLRKILSQWTKIPDADPG